MDRSHPSAAWGGKLQISTHLQIQGNEWPQVRMAAPPWCRPSTSCLCKEARSTFLLHVLIIPTLSLLKDSLTTADSIDPFLYCQKFSRLLYGVSCLPIPDQSLWKHASGWCMPHNVHLIFCEEVVNRCQSILRPPRLTHADAWVLHTQHPKVNCQIQSFLHQNRGWSWGLLVMLRGCWLFWGGSAAS